MKSRGRPALAVGQAWSFRRAPNPRSRVVIGRIDRIVDGEVFHVAVVDVPAPADLQVGGRLVNVTHLPFDRAALEASLGDCLGEEETPIGFEEGLEIWYEEEREGRAGVFGVSIAEALDILYEAPDPDDD